ncbi:hypothetical protein M2390_002941 [Mycetocola sp. BIGb0189]|uniref:hypothetical protein n=1 Tax=Mycetocola sp. BIGb0189 TaxID=2940604 RepID=UPI002167AFE6|nr:hypothetical protein [Mycetocola sp. BIGb0189]MCS4277732.1 hypothetical protein [Mycetocola sp. BIGb0189]
MIPDTRNHVYVPRGEAHIFVGRSPITIRRWISDDRIGVTESGLIWLPDLIELAKRRKRGRPRKKEQ